MRRILLGLTVLLVGLLAAGRNRIYLRDPLAHVDRNGVRAEKARVYISYSNDVLVQTGALVYLVQAWNHVPGVPTALTCVRELACLTDADRAASLPLLVDGRPPSGVAMSDRSVSFVEGGGATVSISLR